MTQKQSNDDQPSETSNNTVSSATTESAPTQKSNDNSNTGGSLPGRRLYNPLSEFSTYTYNLSLYMISPEAYDAFIASGRRNINALGSVNNTTNQAAGVYIIAQSGGVNNQSEQRAPGFEFDYYIDNLKMTGSIAPAATGAPTVQTDITFNIYEPYGFSFVSNLKRAQDSLQQYMQQSGKSQKGLENPTRQFYILGIRFVGYDSQGNIMAGDKGKSLDPSANVNGIFETFYDIALTNIKFKLTGRMVTYNCFAKMLPSKEAFGTKRGLVDTGANIEAGTVYDALLGEKGLITKINNEQQRLYNAGSIGIKDTYKVVFLSDMEEQMKAAQIVSPADLDKYKWGGPNSKKTSDSNDATASKSIPNNNVRNIVIQGTTPIIQAISQIISQSSFLEDALKVLYTTNLEPNQGKKTENEIENKNKTTVSWYNISAQIAKAEWDEKRADFALEITYLIAPYDTPIIMSAYTNPGAKYYGPYKRYDYWYTGLNSEIISYEQTLDNAYYNVALVPSTSDGQGKGGPVDVALKANQRTNMPRLGRTDVGLEAHNSYLTSLYDPKGWAEAKINILGDPDYLIQDAEDINGVGQLYNKFYGTDGFTIKGSNQVFIEIDFKEAIDYEHNTGTLKINESILFFKYPKSISQLVKGISYLLIKVESTFSNGKFTQVLHCRLNTFGDATDDTGDKRTNNFDPTTGAGEFGSSTTASSGLRPDNTSSGSPAISNAGVNASAQPNNQQQNSNGVANDDGATNYAVGLPGA